VKVEKRTISSIERDFGVKEQTVRNWLKDHKDAEDPEKVRIAELEVKLKEANKKIADHEMTIDIQKKPPPSSRRTTGNEVPLHPQKCHRVSG